MKKKIALFILGLFFAALVVSSCGTSNKCAAYGEHRQFQVERK